MVFGCSGSVMVFGESITSKNRSAAVRVSKVIDSRKPIDSTGNRSTVAVAKNATSSPTVICAGRGQPDAAEQAQRERDIGDQQQPEPDAGDGLRLLDLGAAQLLGLVGEVLQRVLAAAERLEHPDAVHRLLDGGREVAGLVLAAPGDRRSTCFSKT